MSWSFKWFLEQVEPLLQPKFRSLHSYVEWDSAKTLSNKNMTLIGRDKSKLTYLRNACVALIPQPFASLQDNRLLQAAACQIPLVSTSLGVAGWPFKHNEHILIADTPTEFAYAIHKLVEDRAFAAYIAENSFRLVSEQFGLKRLKEEVKKILTKCNETL
jgi:glycosyltransferase involved in cell wall biosynthesis